MAKNRFAPLCAQGLAIAAIAVGGLSAPLLTEPEQGPVAAVFPPWWGGMRAFQAASEIGPVLRFGLTDFVVLVAENDATDRAKLKRAGAWLLLNPRGLAGCAWKTERKLNDR